MVPATGTPRAGEAADGRAEKEGFHKESVRDKEVVQKGKTKENDRPRGYHTDGTKKGNDQNDEAHLD